MLCTALILFSVSGYHTAVTVKKINENTLSKIENFAKKFENLVDIYNGLHDIDTIKKLLFGTYANESFNFLFNDEDKETIRNIVAFTQMHVNDAQDDQDYCFFIEESSKMESAETNAQLYSTAIGQLFHFGWYFILFIILQAFFL